MATLSDSGGGLDDGDPVKRRRVKIRKSKGDDGVEESLEETDKEPNLSFKDQLMGVASGDFTKDKRGSRVFDEAWNEYIEGLKGFFSTTAEEGFEQNVEEDDEDCPTLRVSQEEYERWCAPWRKSLIIKLLGKNVPLSIMKSNLDRLWKTTKPFTTRDLDNGFFVVSFEDVEDMNQIYQDGPWMVADRYLIVQRWRPNFDPWNADFQKEIAAWIRILSSL